MTEENMVLFRADCIKCNECQDICPEECIEIRKDGAYKDQELCTKCDRCVDVCSAD